MAKELQVMRDGNSQHIIVSATLGGTGAQTVNVFTFSGTIRILDQFAHITRVGTLANCTGVYADAYDGTNTVELTADGAVLSGATVGSLFTKDKVAAQIYSVSLADEVRLLETLETRTAGRPFLITAKNGVTNYIRFHYTTTDAPIDFDMEIHFEYELMDGSTLELA